MKPSPSEKPAPSSPAPSPARPKLARLRKLLVFRFDGPRFGRRFGPWSLAIELTLP